MALTGQRGMTSSEMDIATSHVKAVALVIPEFGRLHEIWGKTAFSNVL